MKNQKPINLRVKVKPVFPVIIHSGSYEGPCRTGDENTLSPEAERARSKELFHKFQEMVRDKLTSEADVLEPAYLEHGDDWLIGEEEFKKLEREETDLYLVNSGADLAQFVAVKIGERYKKPVAMVGGESDANIPKGCDAVSHLRAKGLEGYVLLSYSELNHLISLLKVRKSVSETKILRITEKKFDNVNGNFLNLDELKMRFGIDSKDISIGEFAKEMDRVTQSKDEQEKAEDIVDKLIKNAQQVHMKREYIANDVNFYLTAKNLMRKYECNAFTANCFELCPDRRLASQRKVIPCLTHTLLKDEGIPSACEGDINVLLTIMLLIYASKRSVYMGNIFMMSREENIMSVLHDVPGIKMRGITTQPDLPYEIRNFTRAGWGTTIRYDFSRDKGKKVTIARFNPAGSKILAVRGEITGGEGVNSIGCSLRAFVKVPNVATFFRNAANFGNHSVLVYGDYVQKLKELGVLMNFEVVEGNAQEQELALSVDS